MDLNFTWNLINDLGNVQEVELIENGRNILITEQNKKLFVEKV